MKLNHSIFVVCIFVCLYETVKSTPCRHGFIPLRNSCYHFSSKSGNWVEAGGLCQGMGARLVSIETAEEALDIHLHILYKLQNSSYWTSGTDLGTEGRFRWSSTGKIFDYAAWCHGQPDNSLKKEHCVEIRHTDHLTCWNDLPCEAKTSRHLPMFFICEY